MTRPPPHAGRTERVRLPGRPTDVTVAPGCRNALREVLTERYPRAERIGLVIDAEVDRLWALPDLPEGPRPVRVAAPAGEAAKTRDVLALLQDRLVDLRRDEPVVAVGGGAVLDVAGLAAATVRRGLPWIALPTTVVGMADASVGGKVAVNHPRGKNLLGTFHPPGVVLADVDYLGTLGDRDVAAGLAEVYKVGRIRDEELLASLREGPPSTPSAWVATLARAVAAKARIVEEDERDHGVRRALNYGHTVGHALERLLGAEAVRHGEAVAVGMGVAARLARARGVVDEDLPARQDADLVRLGLPTRPPAPVTTDAVLEVLALDKKRLAGRGHTFVLPRGEHGVDVVDDVTDEEVVAALAPWSGRGS